MNPTDLRYAKSHEWVKITGEHECEVGITDYAQDSLGDLVFVNLPEIDADAVKAHTTAGDISGTLLTDKSVSAHTTTGDISVPDTEGGSCELSTTTGDIRIKISD